MSGIFTNRPPNKKNPVFKPLRATPARVFNPSLDSDRMYKSDTWKMYRFRFLRQNTRCYSCGDKATVVDHLRPHKGDEKLFRQLDNHIPLCAACHNFVTAKFDRTFIVGASIDPKLTWLAKQREERGLTSRVRVLPSFIQTKLR